MPKYDITVQLTGTDGNAFFLMARVGTAIEDVHGVEAKNEFYHAAQKMPSYGALLDFLSETVNVE